ncbi:MAG: hypothetical protein HYS86_04845 [Candidatus Chisholmbacteria bacterium]|nr:hypothetical protein [Candidatus Chisholmbacteria bacterium]
MPVQEANASPQPDQGKGDLQQYFEQQCGLPPEYAEFFASTWNGPAPTVEQFYRERWGPEATAQQGEG